MAPAKRAAVPGKEGGAEADGVGRVDIVAAVVSDVEDFSGGDPAATIEGRGDGFVEERGGFGFVNFVGPDAVGRLQTEGLGRGFEEGVKEEWSEELGVGDDAEGVLPGAEGGKGRGEFWHGPNRVDSKLEIEGQLLDDLVQAEDLGLVAETEVNNEPPPDTTDIDFGPVDAVEATLVLFVFDEVAEMGFEAVGSPI